MCSGLTGHGEPPLNQRFVTGDEQIVCNETIILPATARMPIQVQV
jgi:hypothetical protein